MLKNYVTTAIRNFLRQKVYTFLNIAGLTIGIASSLLIFLWVQDERNVDRFHEKDAQIYQILRNMYLAEEQILTTQAVPQPVKPELENAYPEVDQVTLIGWDIEYLITREDFQFRETGKYVSPEFLEIYSYPVILGDPASALDEPNNIMISKPLAVKIFGQNWRDRNILGTALRLNHEEDFAVSGVFEVPASSSLEFDWLISARKYISENSWVENWGNGGFRMAFTFHEGADPEAFIDKAQHEVNNHTNNGSDERLMIQRYSDRYLLGTYENGVLVGGRIDNVRILSIVAVFILIIACINFMNLSTARSSRRAQEIGLRKVMGARRGALGIQFLTESLVISFFSVILAVMVVSVTLPYFNNLSGKTMVIDLLAPGTWLLLGAIALMTGVLAGSYPALLLPAFKITTALKGTISHSRGATFFRRVLVVFQFAVSIILIIGTITVFNQMEYIMNKNLGMDRENLVFIEMEGQTRQNFESYKNELLRIPEVKSVTSTSGNPLSYGRSSSSPSWDGKDPDMNVEMNILMVSQDMVETMDMHIIDGRDFNANYGLDSANYLINEEAARIMGFENPVGQNLSCWGVDGQIVGLLKNFHMSSMYNQIEPLVIRYDPQNTYLAFVRVQGDTQDALLAIEKVTRSMNPEYPFQYEFLDAEYAATYRSEQTISVLANIFAFITIVISCLGLFGLSSYSAELRTRELGIRKVHGANVLRLVLMLSREFSFLIVAAFVIAAPLAWYVASNWLDRFVFHTTLSWGIFVTAGLGALGIAFLTVSYKSYKAAASNPIDTLKEE